MAKIWEFFEDMHDFVAVTDLDTRELVYMNKKLRDMSGMLSHTDYQGKKCYEVIQHGYTPCAMCKNHELSTGHFLERSYYNPVWNKNFFVRDTVIEDEGRRLHVEISIDAGTAEQIEENRRTQSDLEGFVNDALRVALKRDTPDDSIMVLLRYIGERLGGERTYVFEKNEKGNDDNTYEWVRDGVTPQKQQLSDVPEEVCAGWYQNFGENRHIVIRDLEDIKKSDPRQYENLKRRNVHSLVVVPLYLDGKAIGFYGIDNPSDGSSIDRVSNILQMMAYYIVSAIRRRALIQRLQNEEQEKAAESYQKQMSEKLAKSTQEYLDMVNDIIGSGLWYVNFDRNGELERVCRSDKYRSMLGFSEKKDFPEELEPWSDRLHPKEKGATLAVFWDCIEGKGEYDVKYRLRKKNGEYDWFHDRGQTVRYENGKPRLFVGTLINITKEMQAQQALEEAYQAANRANAAKTEFMANMSHNIRTPLNAIIGMTAIASAYGGGGEKLGHYLSEISNSSKQLLALVNDVLDMNRIEAGQISLQVEPFDMAEMLKDFLEEAKPLVEAKQHELVVNTEDIRHKQVYGDREQIMKCLMNFMSNAAKYTSDGGRICFTASEKETNRPRRGCYEFVFKDNGIGMTEEVREHIFEPFARSDDPRVMQQGGVGLGLPITRNVIRMMNGDVKVESRLDEGSVFTADIFLKLQEENADDALLSGEPSPASKEPSPVSAELSSAEETAAPAHKERHILLVEDNELNAEITMEILNMNGLNTVHVWNGKEAVEEMERVEDGHYDLIFMDLRMPVMNGYEATAAIRSSDRRYLQQIPIIALSANALAEDVQASLSSGMNAHIAKPLDFQHLLSVMNEWFEGKGSL